MHFILLVTFMLEIIFKPNVTFNATENFSEIVISE